MSTWSPGDIADALEVGLLLHERALAEEHAVRGLDAHDEVGLHPIINAAFERAEYGVYREVRYPADRNKQRQSEGERCDIVLTPDSRELEQPDRGNTLFDSPNAVALEDAYWMEIKVAHQFTIEGPNPRYAASMLSIAKHDVTKLSKGRDILHAGLGLIAFMQDEEIARHDLQVWYESYVLKGLPVGFPSTRLLPIQDRIGNSICAISIAPVNHL